MFKIGDKNLEVIFSKDLPAFAFVFFIYFVNFTIVFHHLVPGCPSRCAPLGA